MAVTPPESRIWWKEPVAKIELTWVIIAFLWGLVMFFMMIYWHIAGNQNLSNEAYRIDAATFTKYTQAMVDKYTVGQRTTRQGGREIPIVAPPPGSDVYLIARLWEWWPILQLQKGKSYRLHISSLDWQHGFSLQPVNINLQVHPGYELVTTITPRDNGEFTVVCNEFCGIGHHNMLGKILVVE
ncbi:MAG TPA: cytochrome C oxidase subunit II [Burkholderiales bacterium]